MLTDHFISQGAMQNKNNATVANGVILITMQLCEMNGFPIPAQVHAVTMQSVLFDHHL